eukprot:2860026-Rhodomonas_salina.2
MPCNAGLEGRCVGRRRRAPDHWLRQRRRRRRRRRRRVKARDELERSVADGGDPRRVVDQARPLLHRQSPLLLQDPPPRSRVPLLRRAKVVMRQRVAGADGTQIAFA